MSDDTHTDALNLASPPHRKWVITLAVPILLITVIICLQQAWRQAAQHRLDATIDAIATSNEPIHFTDMVVRDITDDSNAAHFYLQALDRWPCLPDGKLITESGWYLNKDDLEWYEGDPAQLVDPITDNAAYLIQCEKAIDLLRRGAEAADCSWPIELAGSPIQTNLPHLRQMRSLARLIDDAARRAHQIGDDPQTLRLIGRLLDIADDLEVRPSCLITHLVAVSLRSMAMSTVEDTLPTWAIDDVVPRQTARALIARLLDDGRMRQYFGECWISERWMCYNSALSIIEGRDDADDADQPLNLGGIKGSFMGPVLMNDTELFVSALTNDVTAARTANNPSHFSELAGNQEIVQTIEKHPNLHMLSAIMLPALDVAVNAHFQSVAHMHMAAAAIAIHLYELDHGRRPQTLEQLVPDYLPAVPTDSMSTDDQSIHYLPQGVTPAVPPQSHLSADDQAKLPHGPFPILYSVGRNTQDDGGLIFYDDDGMISDDLRYQQGDQYFLLVPAPEATIKHKAPHDNVVFEEY